MYTLSLKLESENATVKVTDALNRKSTSINRQDMISVSLPRMSKPGLMNAIPKLGGASIPPEETLNKKKIYTLSLKQRTRQQNTWEKEQRVHE